MTEMKCVVCDKSIPRGQRFIGDRYKTIKFCCEECYNSYCFQKDTAKEKARQETKKRNKVKKENQIDGWKSLTDYIAFIYPPDTINWSFLSKQIKTIMRTYDITCDEIKKTIKYAIEFEHHELIPEYSIGQFIPKYIDKMRNFRKKIESNRLNSNSNKEDEIIVIKSSALKKNYRRLENFDE